jgi:hypothetical protein
MDASGTSAVQCDRYCREAEIPIKEKREAMTERSLDQLFPVEICLTQGLILSVILESTEVEGRSFQCLPKGAQFHL